LRGPLFQEKQRLEKIIGENIKEINRIGDKTVTSQDIKNKNSWFWKDRIPNVDTILLQRWKITQKVLRCQEELKFLEIEIQTMDKFRTQMDEFYNFYNRLRSQDE
jgi:hypothetical protein